MKHYFSIIFAALCLAGCLVTGCKKPEEIFSISQVSDLKIDATEQNFTVEVTAPEAWKASSDADWAVVTATESSFRVNVSANTVAAERSGKISVTCGSQTLGFNIIQAGAVLKFELFKEGGEPVGDLTVKGAGETLELYAQTNLPLYSGSYKIEGNEDWISGKAVENLTFEVEFKPNTTGAKRAGSFDVISPDGSKLITVKVEQNSRELADNIVFTAPDQISYCLNGEDGVEYYTGLFETADFKTYDLMFNDNLFLSFIQASTGFMAVPGEVRTISKSGDIVTYSGKTAAYMMGMFGAIDIKEGVNYMICVCKKEDADDNNQQGDFFTLEFVAGE